MKYYALTGGDMTSTVYTARETLEIKGALTYFFLNLFIGSIGIAFQIITRMKLSTVMTSFVFSASLSMLAFFIYNRKKNRKTTSVFEWAVGLISVIVVMLIKVNYSRTQDWTYAAQSYQLAALSVAFLIIIQFLYNKRLMITTSLLYFSFWIFFLFLAEKHGVTFHMFARVDGKVVHDGIQFHREIYFMIMMMVVTFASYKNIPVIEKYDTINIQQLNLIEKSNSHISGLFERTNSLFNFTILSSAGPFIGYARYLTTGI